jgi:hypothetical protein
MRSLQPICNTTVALKFFFYLTHRISFSHTYHIEKSGPCVFVNKNKKETILQEGELEDNWRFMCQLRMQKLLENAISGK